MNYPSGLTQSQHAAHFGPPANESRYGNLETCFLCQRSFLQDTFERLWFLEDDVDTYGMGNLSYSKAVDPFNTQFGWCCSQECWDEHHEEPVEEVA